MSVDTSPDPNWTTFSLLGGPLHRLGVRLGLVRNGTNTLRLGLAIGATLWIVAAALSLLAGRDLFSLAMLGAHVRLLLAIPLLFLAESVLDQRLDGFLQVMVRSRVVPGKATAALLEDLARMRRWVNSVWPDALCLLLAISLHWVMPYLQMRGLDATVRLAGVIDLGPAGTWYSVVCLTVLRFLILRWIFRLVLWWHCLWFLSRLPLRLVPAHSDGVAGLGALDMVHAHFAPLVLTISVVLAASFAVDIDAGVMPLTAVLPAAAAILLLDAILFIAPLLLFARPLWACKVKGIGDYMVLAERYSAGFEKKWIHGDGAGEELLGSSDIQSLADLTTAIEVVRGIRILPASTGTMFSLGVVALLPLAPLALFQYPLHELAGQMMSRLIGL